MEEDIRSRIVRNQEWNATTAELDAADLAELVLSLLVLDAVNGEAALGVVDQAEVLAGLLDGDDVHEASGVGHVGADLVVDLDQALLQDGLGLAVVQGVLETVAQEDDERQALAGLVGTGRRLGGVDAGQFVQQPVRGGAQALLVLLPGWLLDDARCFFCCPRDGVEVVLSRELRLAKVQPRPIIVLPCCPP